LNPGSLDTSGEHLAGFKCPRGVFFTTELPRNAAQKVLKKELQRDILGGESIGFKGPRIQGFE